MVLSNQLNIKLLQMKKGGTAEKCMQPKGVTKSVSEIRFNLSAHNLACFKGKDKTPIGKVKGELGKDIKWLSQIKCPSLSKGTDPNVPAERGRAISCSTSFNEQVVIMHYDNIDVYIDNSTRKKSNSSDSNSSARQAKKSDPDEGAQDEFVQSCVRAITQQTDNTSNTLSLSTYQMTPPSLTPRSSEMDSCYDMYNCYPKSKPVRNRQSVTVEESRRFTIDYDNISNDERTTVMVKNIPNKYTQEMLLDEFTINYENKFDFFYLPIDKDNDCNVGYAFVNFINTAYLKEFYQQFHLQKWKQYKSPKICNICYARYQGTLQLADHFKHTKIINQKDRKIKPLMGTEASRIKDLKEIIKNQRSHE